MAHWMESVRTCISHAVRNSVQTEVRISIDELREYAVHDDTDIYFSLWEFRAAIAAAETLGSHVRLEFARGGDPLFLRLDMGALRAEFILATAEQPTITPQRKRPARHAPNPPHTRTSSRSDPPPCRASPPTPGPAPDSLPEPIPTAVKSSTSQADADLDDVLLVRPKRELTPPPVVHTETIAPTPAEDGGSRDEHTSLLFGTDAHSPPWPDDDDRDEMPPTQMTQRPQKMVRHPPTHLLTRAVSATV